MPRPEDEYDDFDSPRRRDDDAFDRAPPPRPRSRGLVAVLIIIGVVVVLCGGCGIAALVFSTTRVRDAANRIKSENNLKQIGLGIHMYHDQESELPGNSYGPDGTPLLSWRVHILPYMEADDLYKQFKLDEPWDSPNNIRLLSQMPPVYANPAEPRGVGSKTYYRGFSSPGAVFEKRPDGHQIAAVAGGPAAGVAKKERFGLGNIQDMTSNTIMLVEAGDPVEWTRPDDLDASPGKPFPKLGGIAWKNKRINVLLVNGHVIPMRRDTPETTFRALVTHSGGEVLPPGWNE